MAKNRNNYDILGDCLATIEHEDSSITRIMYIASLSYQQLTTIRAQFEARGLAQLVEGRWQITQKGRDVLNAIRILQGLLA